MWQYELPEDIISACLKWSDEYKEITIRWLQTVKNVIICRIKSVSKLYYNYVHNLYTLYFLTSTWRGIWKTTLAVHVQTQCPICPQLTILHCPLAKPVVNSLHHRSSVGHDFGLVSSTIDHHNLTFSAPNIISLLIPKLISQYLLRSHRNQSFNSAWNPRSQPKAKSVQSP
jgi:hypothetical protein